MVTTVAAGPLLGEKIGPAVNLSALLILFGVYLVQRKRRISRPLDAELLPND
jgi:drug/metabolite transporter (DMT)-like permease